MTRGEAWQIRHEAAMRDPNLRELPLVDLVRCLGSLVVDHGQDQVLREGVAQVLTGTQRLLVADWGDRLDMGSIDEMLMVCAEVMDFDLDTEEFRQ